MRTLLSFVLLLLACTLHAGELFYRAHSATSVTLGDICVPAADGVGIFAVDFNTTNLTITISAQGDGVDSVFTYTGANLDDYDATPPAWGNPAASAIEVEAQGTNCLKLHVRDEVWAVSGASEWSIRFTDAATDAIMDWHVQVLALATAAEVQAASEDALAAHGTATEANVDAVEVKVDGIDTAVDGNAASLASIEDTLGSPTGDDIASDIATAQLDLDTITGTGGALIAAAEEAAIATATAEETWDLTCEDQGGGLTCREALSVMLSEAIGQCTYNDGTRTWTCEDPSGGETRFTLVYGPLLDGTRTSSTPSPVTP